MDRLERNATPLRVMVHDEMAADRTQKLARNLDERLSKNLERIRTQILREPESDKRSPNPPGTGRRLDMLA